MPRITLTLERYLELGRSVHENRACFACRFIGTPLPPSAPGDVMLRCQRCGAAAAVTLDRAAAEGWLAVEHDGRLVNDTGARA